MGTFPFHKDFEPVVRRDDYVEFLPTAKFRGITYKVQQVEPIQPFMVDWLQLSGATSNSPPSVAAGGNSNTLDTDTLRKIFETDQNIFAQWRIDLLDDFLLSLGDGANAQRYVTSEVFTALSKRLPEHRATKLLPSGTLNTDTLLWANTSSKLLGGNINGQSPTRKARLVGLIISTTAADTIFFADSTTTGSNITQNGSGVPVSTTVFFVPIATGDYVVLGRDSIPDELYFNTGLLISHSSASNTVVTAIVEEQNAAIFGGNLLSEREAVENMNNELYTSGIYVPTGQIFNPLQIALATAKTMIGGYQFAITAEAPPSGVKPIGIPMQRLPRIGPPPGV